MEYSSILVVKKQQLAEKGAGQEAEQNRAPKKHRQGT
jgi:hypothetical protein